MSGLVKRTLAPLTERKREKIEELSKTVPILRCSITSSLPIAGLSASSPSSTGGNGADGDHQLTKISKFRFPFTGDQCREQSRKRNSPSRRQKLPAVAKNRAIADNEEENTYSEKQNLTLSELYAQEKRMVDEMGEKKKQATPDDAQHHEDQKNDAITNRITPKADGDLCKGDEHLSKAEGSNLSRTDTADLSTDVRSSSADSGQRPSPSKTSTSTLEAADPVIPNIGITNFGGSTSSSATCVPNTSNFYGGRIISVKPGNIKYTQASVNTRFLDGHSVFQTLHDLEDGNIRVADIHPIQIIDVASAADTQQHLVGYQNTNTRSPTITPTASAEGVYYSLNNRRLFALKHFSPNALIRCVLVQGDPAISGQGSSISLTGSSGVEIISPRAYWTKGSAEDKTPKQKQLEETKPHPTDGFSPADLAKRRNEHIAAVLPRQPDADGRQWLSGKKVINVNLCIADIMKKERERMNIQKHTRSSNDRRILDMMLFSITELAYQVSKCKQGTWSHMQSTEHHHGGGSSLSSSPMHNNMNASTSTELSSAIRTINGLLSPVSGASNLKERSSSICCSGLISPTSGYKSGGRGSSINVRPPACAGEMHVSNTATTPDKFLGSPFFVYNNRAMIVPYYKVFQDVLAWKQSSSVVWKESNFFSHFLCLQDGVFFTRAAHDKLLIHELVNKLGFTSAKKLDTEYCKKIAVKMGRQNMERRMWMEGGNDEQDAENKDIHSTDAIISPEDQKEEQKKKDDDDDQNANKKDANRDRTNAAATTDETEGLDNSILAKGKTAAKSRDEICELWDVVMNHHLGEIHAGIDKFTWPYGVASEQEFSKLSRSLQEEYGKEWLLLTW